MSTPAPAPSSTAQAQTGAVPGTPLGCGPDSGERRRLNSEQLFGPAQEVEISHGGAVYRLRRTALGKLILTK